MDMLIYCRGCKFYVMIIIITKEIHVIGKSRDLLVSVKLVPL